jgi:hypothetical protein
MVVSFVTGGWLNGSSCTPGAVLWQVLQSAA